MQVQILLMQVNTSSVMKILDDVINNALEGVQKAEHLGLMFPNQRRFNLTRRKYFQRGGYDVTLSLAILGLNKFNENGFKHTVCHTV